MNEVGPEFSKENMEKNNRRQQREEGIAVASIAASILLFLVGASNFIYSLKNYSIRTSELSELQKESKTAKEKKSKISS